MTALELARIQCGFTVSAHIIFPAFTVGMASWLAVLNTLWLWKRDEALFRLFEPGIIASAVLACVVLDGFDLGIGILFPWPGQEEDRELAMATVAPVWAGNETWLVLGGGGLLAVFPLAYAVVMPALHPLIITMLLGLIFRGVAFEFIFRTTRWRGVWERGFFVGSLLAAPAQGLALGGLVQPDESLRFLLVGSAVLIPMILAYTGYSYWVFRGRVRPGQSYHGSH